MKRKSVKKRNLFVFDSFALLAFFQAEEGAEAVKVILEKALKKEAHVYMSAINLGEIYYLSVRKLGEIQAGQMLDDIEKLPITIEEASLERIMEAARIKARYLVSYADAFCISLAKELKAPVVTGDPEFNQLDSLIEIIWLRESEK